MCLSTGSHVKIDLDEWKRDVETCEKLMRKVEISYQKEEYDADSESEPEMDVEMLEKNTAKMPEEYPAKILSKVDLLRLRQHYDDWDEITINEWYLENANEFKLSTRLIVMRRKHSRKLEPQGPKLYAMKKNNSTKVNIFLPFWML